MNTFYFWPQGRLLFSDNTVCGNWSAEVSLDSPGDYWVIVGRMSPDLSLLYEYYWDFGHELKEVREHLVAVLPAEHQAIATGMNCWKRIERNDKRLPGLKNLSRFQLRLLA